MKLAAPVSFLLLAGSIALAAQTSNPLLSPGTYTDMPPEKNNCSLPLHVRQMASGTLLDAKIKPHKGIGQALSLSITTSDSRKVVKGSVTVHGTDKGRLTPALSNLDASSGAARTFSVKFSPESDKTDVAYLWVPGLTSVQSVDLNSVSYSDGSNWKLTPGDSCRFVPDGVVPVSPR